MREPVSDFKKETSVFVDNLPSSARNQDVARIFRKFGRCDVQIEKNWTYAHIDFESTQSAKRAVESLHKSSLMGQVIEVTFNSQLKNEAAPSIKKDKTICKYFAKNGFCTKLDCEYTHNDDDMSIEEVFVKKGTKNKKRIEKVEKETWKE